jgi:hypothetical protein
LVRAALSRREAEGSKKKEKEQEIKKQGATEFI